MSPNHSTSVDADTPNPGTSAVGEPHPIRRPITRLATLLAIGLVVVLAAACDVPGLTVEAVRRDDELAVLGTDDADVITLRLQAGDPGMIEVDVAADGTADFRFDRAGLQSIVVKGFGGDDRIVADPSNGAFTDVAVTVLDGGDGSDTLIGANAGESLYGGPGDDVLEGNSGSDTVAGGDGADVFPWDPGDNSDTIQGGSGLDQLAFNGSGASETYGMSTLAGHVRLTRDVANVVMDLDDVEAIDLRSLGGADRVNVQDLTFTDLATFTADLAGPGGVDDAQIDELVVGPGLPISWDGPAALVSGLGAEVRAVNGAQTDRVHVTGTVVSDVVPVVGTTGTDVVSTVADGTDVAVFGPPAGPHVRLTAVEQLDVDLAGGDDQFSAVGNLAALVALGVDGGDGADTLLGGNGADVLAGGPGDDFVDGNQGVDSVSGGDGVDVFQWDPGDGSDIITGGAGADRLVFHGSTIGEIYDLTAAVGHVRLTRNIGAVLLDLDEVEAVDLRVFGGADLVTANDLSGTDLATLMVDLALIGGGDDGQVDQVVVNGSPGDDTVGVVAESGQVVVQGLAPTLRIAGAAPVDRLTVNGLAGNDTITPTAAAAALILLDLLP